MSKGEPNQIGHKMEFPEILVLRHGETEWNLAGKWQGHLNSPLTEQGRAQARQQNAILKTIDLSGFSAVCSPQLRALQTAALALDQCIDDCATDDRLREIAVGEWTGLDRDKILSQATSDWGPFAHYDDAPGGEGFERLSSRCHDFLADLKGPTVIITHGITSRMLRVLAMGQHYKTVGDVPGGQGVVHRVKNRKHSSV